MHRERMNVFSVDCIYVISLSINCSTFTSIWKKNHYFSANTSITFSELFLTSQLVNYFSPEIETLRKLPIWRYTYLMLIRHGPKATINVKSHLLSKTVAMTSARYCKHVLYSKVMDNNWQPSHTWCTFGLWFASWSRNFVKKGYSIH